uniref:Prolyl 4-hydroxylase alpha-subunit N-terminal domain-containing protein n=1 Tax=Clastoptera arizonana TaxID=38151 RepID=A0A1B6E6C3_9HEMI
MRVVIVFLSFCLIGFSKEFDKATFLNRLDDNIVEYMVNPSKELADRILDELDLYNQSLNSIIELINLRDPGVLETCREILDRRGPRTLHEEVDESYLQKGFGWTDEKLTEFRNIIGDTKLLWDMFKKSFVTMKPLNLNVHAMF